MNTIYLTSVSSYYSPETGMVYPSEFNDGYRTPVVEEGQPLEEMGSYWIDSLSDNDVNYLMWAGLDPYTE